jgi:hypothetical protein
MSSERWVDASPSGLEGVSEYKVYVLDADEHVGAPAHGIECDNDEEAIRQARQYVDGKPVEVWREITLVAPP